MLYLRNEIGPLLVEYLVVSYTKVPRNSNFQRSVPSPSCRLSSLMHRRSLNGGFLTHQQMLGWSHLRKEGETVPPSGSPLLNNCLDFVVKTVTVQVWPAPMLLNFSDLTWTGVSTWLGRGWDDCNLIDLISKVSLSSPPWRSDLVRSAEVLSNSYFIKSLIEGLFPQNNHFLVCPKSKKTRLHTLHISKYSRI